MGCIVYQGMWINNLPNGFGTLDNMILDCHYEGMWENGMLYVNENEYYDYSQHALIKLHEDQYYVNKKGLPLSGDFIIYQGSLENPEPAVKYYHQYIILCCD